MNIQIYAHFVYVCYISFSFSYFAAPLRNGDERSHTYAQYTRAQLSPASVCFVIFPSEYRAMIIIHDDVSR